MGGSAKLTKREEEILCAIIDEYIERGEPVGSGTLHRKYGFGVSPATIRNEMMKLEVSGFVKQPYNSAGRVPLKEGYRYYVESLMGEGFIPEDMKCEIRHQFGQIEEGLVEWGKLTASILARLSRNVGVILLPGSGIKEIELSPFKGRLISLTLHFEDGRVKRKLITSSEVLSSSELSDLASSIMDDIKRGIYTSGEPFKNLILSGIKEMMGEDFIIDGLRYFLSSPEFKGRASEVIELFERREPILSPILSAKGEGIKVIIGAGEGILDEMSFVLSSYGMGEEFEGVLGVIGPLRMRYREVISGVRFLSEVMVELCEKIMG